jgi:hypothetical protein
MITLNTPTCGAVASFPETVPAELGGQLLLFDHMPDQAFGSAFPGPCSRPLSPARILRARSAECWMSAAGRETGPACNGPQSGTAGNTFRATTFDIRRLHFILRSSG